MKRLGIIALAASVLIVLASCKKEKEPEKKVVVDIEGAKYSGENIVISNNTTLGVSNSFVDDEVKISVLEGAIIVVVSSWAIYWNN